MPDLLTDPAHWQLRAHEARGQAQKLSDPEAKAAKHQMAEKYERLAARATEWMFLGFLDPPHRQHLRIRRLITNRAGDTRNIARCR